MRWRAAAWLSATLFAATLSGCPVWAAPDFEAWVGAEASPPAVLAILDRSCGGCHGSDSGGDGGFDEVDDLQALVDLGLVVANDPDRSSLLARMERGEMPPYGWEPRPTDQELATIRAWIAAGAPAEAPTDPSPPDPGLPPQVRLEQAVELMTADLTGMAEEDRAFQRFVLLGNLHDARVDPDAVAQHRAGIDLLLNSLSFEPTSTPAQAVDPAGLVLRLDLRDYGWIGEYYDRWELLTLGGPHPSAERADADALRELAGTEVPWVHGDWLLATASEPPLYYDLLGLPDRGAEIAAVVGVDREDNLGRANAARAGFVESGVSVSNRLIERHDSPYGAFWWSYDFASSQGDANLFSHPLDFVEDGGEAIFSLPNGLQAYVIVNADDVRIDVAPTSIVSDSTHPDTPAVQAGISCFSCHGVDGVLPKTDEIRPYVEANPESFGEEVVSEVQALHPTADAMDDLQYRDRDAYQRALAEAGLEPGAALALVGAVDGFRDAVDLERAASDLWITTDQLRAVLDNVPASELLELRVITQTGGRIDRSVFESSLDRLADFLP